MKKNIINQFEEARRHSMRGKSMFELDTNYRATHDTTSNPNLANIMFPNLSISDSSKSSLLQRLGVSMYQHDMNRRINISNITDAAKVAEGSPLPETVLTSQQILGVPKRIGIQLKLSNELLPSNRDEGSWFAPVLTSMIDKAMMGGLANEMITLLNALTPVSGYEAATNPDVALIRSIATAQQLALKDSAEDSELKWLVASDVSAFMQNSTEDSGSGRFLSEYSQFAGKEIIDSNRMTNQYGFLGNFSKGVVINLPSEFTILIDEYSNGDVGETNIIAQGIYHIDIVDAATNFRTFQNLAIA